MRHVASSPSSYVLQIELYAKKRMYLGYPFHYWLYRDSKGIVDTHIVISLPLSLDEYTGMTKVKYRVPFCLDT